MEEALGARQVSQHADRARRRLPAAGCFAIQAVHPWRPETRSRNRTRPRASPTRSESATCKAHTHLGAAAREKRALNMSKTPGHLACRRVLSSILAMQPSFHATPSSRLPAAHGLSLHPEQLAQALLGAETLRDARRARLRKRSPSLLVLRQNVGHRLVDRVLLG